MCCAHKHNTIDYAMLVKLTTSAEYTSLLTSNHPTQVGQEINWQQIQNYDFHTKEPDMAKFKKDKNLGRFDFEFSLPCILGHLIHALLTDWHGITITGIENREHIY